METQIDIFYEVIDPFTHESFETTDHYIAIHHYEIGYNVNEIHQTVTRLPPFARTKIFVESSWHDQDTEYTNPKDEDV